MLIGYALLLIALGCYGYFVGGSFVSLLMGALSGSLLLIAYVKRKEKWGYSLALGTTLALTLIMGIRAFRTEAVIPGVVFLVSAIVALMLVRKRKI